MQEEVYAPRGILSVRAAQVYVLAPSEEVRAKKVYKILEEGKSGVSKGGEPNGVLFQRMLGRKMGWDGLFFGGGRVKLAYVLVMMDQSRSNSVRQRPGLTVQTMTSLLSLFPFSIGCSASRWASKISSALESGYRSLWT